MKSSNLSPQRIFILGTSIFEEGIAHFLKVGTDLHVTGMKYTSDIAFIEDIKQNQPDVILLNESIPLNSTRILNMLFSLPCLTGRRVIIVRLNNNIIDVYDFPKQIILKKFHKRRQFIVTKRDELVTLCARG